MLGPAIRVSLIGGGSPTRYTMIGGAIDSSSGITENINDDIEDINDDIVRPDPALIPRAR